MANTESFKIVLYGLIKDVTFQVAKYCAQDLNTKDPVRYPTPEIVGMLEFQWDIYIDEKRRELRGETWVFSEAAIIMINGVLKGGPTKFLAWAEKEQNYNNFRPMALYETFADQAYKEKLNAKKHQHVFLDFTINNKAVGRIIIELFTSVVPKTCENFRCFCTGEKGESETTKHALHYKGSIIHRIVKNGWVQGGDTWLKRGNGGESIYGLLFEDESFAISHSARGIVGMVNKGPHTNGSQFYMTLQPTQWMDSKYVAFGKIIEGTKTLKAIEEQNTQNERPLNDVSIIDCGVLTYTF